MTTNIIINKNFTSIIGRGKDRCGAISRRFARSCSASLTILYCSMSSCMIAFCRYLQYRCSTDTVQIQYRHSTAVLGTSRRRVSAWCCGCSCRC